MPSARASHRNHKIWDCPQDIGNCSGRFCGADIQMTMIYVHPAPNAKRAAIETLMQREAEEEGAMEKQGATS